MKTAKEILSKIIFWFEDTNFKLYDLFFLLIYSIMIGFAIWHHEPWSDEALPWMIARDTDLAGFFNMMFYNYDRHPALLHTILIPFTKLGFPYFSQTILNVVLTLVSAVLFITRAPFSRFFRILFLFSYYMLYEYSVITRPYMLTIAILFVIATIYSKREKYPISYATLVSLLFHSDYMGFGLASGLTLVFFLEYGSLFKSRPRMSGAFLWMLLNGLLVFWIGHTLPPDHAEYSHKLTFHFTNVLKPIANAFYPFSNYGWHSVLKYHLAVMTGLVILILAFLSFWHKRIPALVLGTSLVFLLTVFAFFQGGDFRNHGFILISVIFSLWIAKTYPSSAPLQEASSPWNVFRKKAAHRAMLIMGLCFLLGFQNIFFVYALEYYLPFSGAKATADAIKQLERRYQIFERGFVIVAPHKNSVGIMPYLPGVKFWNNCTMSYGAYYKNSRPMGGCNELSETDAVKIAKLYFGDLSKILFIFRNPLPPNFEDPNYDFQDVFHVAKAFGYWYETFFLYHARPKINRKE